jgi:DNA-binding NarL/FixJ family response regulator
LQPIRVVTAELPRILDDIIGAVCAAAGDIEVVGRVARHEELVELTREARPDVVILGMAPSGAATIGWELYVGDPLLRVLGIVGEGRQTFVYELRPHRTALGELSPDGLVAAVRRMAEARTVASSVAGRGVSQ